LGAPLFVFGLIGERGDLTQRAQRRAEAMQERPAADGGPYKSAEKPKSGPGEPGRYKGKE
jgi:hypothetical protein